MVWQDWIWILQGTSRLKLFEACIFELSAITMSFWGRFLLQAHLKVFGPFKGFCFRLGGVTC